MKQKLMTHQEKLDAIDKYFENISSEEFNRICEEKYDIPRPSDEKIAENPGKRSKKQIF
jgi:hypothetical protein